ncbi:MAG: SGNH/GDSL hydrolase family protein [Desulfobacterales bacterium]|nr:SGNH/GDSL hydrolase family protein [Desulfobacterales bacterium]
MKRRSLFAYALLSMVCVLALIGVSCDPAPEARDCVVMIGDSIFDYSDMETEYLQELSGHEYRTYYLNGAQMEGGVIQDIESQYDSAIRAGSIRTVIMDGGGNDYLMGSGSAEEIAEEVRAAYIRILDKAQDDGVQNIVVQGYYLTDSSPDGYAEDAAAMGASLEAAGASRGIKLVFVNPVADAWFASRRPSQYTISDGIHPTDAASERLAQLVWNAMAANGIEQGAGCPSSGGCN